MTTVFRPYSESDALRSDRSASDRKRHRDKLRRSLRENIADIIAEQSIAGRDGSKTVRVPIQGIREYKFVFGDNEGGVGTGNGETQPGQVVGRTKEAKEKSDGKAGNEPGVDIYETEITLDELVEIMFEDLELPDMERKILREAVADRTATPKGNVRKGPRPRLIRSESVRVRMRHAVARGKSHDLREWKEGGCEGPSPVPFLPDYLRYKRMDPRPKPESNAVVMCIMDTSGSMDRLKKYLARSFFFLLFQFLRTKYQKVELVFIGHHTEAKEVNEEEFFHKGESGGTLISSGYKKALEIIADRFHPAHWNIYAFHCSDGDNFESDNEEAIRAAKELCTVCNLFGYGEIKPQGSHYYESSMMDRFRRLKAENFQTVLIERREDIWPSFKAFMSRDRTAAED